VVSSLNNNPFSQAYSISHPSLGNSLWREIFNSDAQFYGGNDTGNQGAVRQSAGGVLEVVIPANGFVVFLRR
jgi:1,4-alpha-glucan branching enzyme